MSPDKDPPSRAIPPSSTAVLAAACGDAVVMVAKFVAFGLTGSAAMLSEAVHSLADTANQLLLAVGIRQSQRAPDVDHPYGFPRSRFVWAMMSAAGVFFMGCGVSVYHGVHRWLHPEPLVDLPWAFGVLAVAAVVEAITFSLAQRVVRQEAREEGMGVWRFALSGDDPVGVAVLAEDGAALIGLAVAALALGASVITGDPRYDAAGSVVIGALLGASALFLMNRNRDLLVGRALPSERRALVLAVLNRHPAVEAVHDVKDTVLGADVARFKAEVVFDGAALARQVLAELDLDAVCAGLQTPDDLERFLVAYGDRLVDTLSREVDAIEQAIRADVPEVRHVDLEAHWADDPTVEAPGPLIR